MKSPSYCQGFRVEGPRVFGANLVHVRVMWRVGAAATLQGGTKANPGVGVGNVVSRRDGAGQLSVILAQRPLFQKGFLIYAHSHGYKAQSVEYVGEDRPPLEEEMTIRYRWFLASMAYHPLE